jgi:hypothetical protein
VRDEGDQLIRPKVAAQQTSTVPNATSGVSVSSSSCATFLSISCQVHEDGGEYEGDRLLRQKMQLNKQSKLDHHVWSPSEVQAAARLLFQRLAKSMRTVVKDKGDQLLRPEGPDQQTNTGPTATCGVSVGSSSCATSLLTSCQGYEESGERRGRPTTRT